MEITAASFITSLASYGPFQGRGLPQIAVAGKSNVGKSSLINALTRSGRLAKTSGTPGKTRLINVFLLNAAFHLIDLPGYGYAKVDKQEQAKWGGRMESYFTAADNLRAVMLLVDIRHDPTADDLQMMAFLRYHGLPAITVATKADKLSRAARHRSLLDIARLLQVQPPDIIPFSAQTGEGRDQLLAALDKALA
ncbi:MAG: ribosome biogenesis GTP-binding protein YihA/YsxC [Christensenellales bacterium]